jgi:ethanolamine permease
MGTLMIMGFLTLFITAGIVDYTKVAALDFPLPAALAAVYGEGSFIALLVNIIGLFGLIASLSGIIVGYSRQTYAMARTGYLPKFLAYVNPKRHTPVWALLVPGLIGLAAALTGLTSTVITISVFGSIMLYLLSLISLFILRQKEPALKRPFKVSYPVVPIISMIMVLFSLYAVFISSLAVVKYVLMIYAVAVVYYFIWGNKKIRPFDEEFGVLDDLNQ